MQTLTGAWHGTSNLWLSPREPAHESESTALVTAVAQERFLTIKYTWSEGGLQDGLLVLNTTPQEDLEAVWIDSWHQSSRFMLLRGSADADGSVSVSGSYPAPPGPDWGWRIALEPSGADSFRMLMFNIPPEGEEELAVEATYSRRE